MEREGNMTLLIEREGGGPSALARKALPECRLYDPTLHRQQQIQGLAAPLPSS